MKGCVFDIQRFSIHDGPGIRTTVFLKGCPLNCRWCCNPESINLLPELMFNPELCIGCGFCVEVCEVGASSIKGFDRSRCTGCGKCADRCYAEAKYVKGRYMEPKDVLEKVLKDVSFYKRTNGGVTFSGGEPLLQIDFLEEVLNLCQTKNLSSAIETCGYVPWKNFERIAHLVEVFLFDIKSTNNIKHIEYTGVGCERIMENCERLTKIAKRLVIRVPVIPGFNYSLDDITQIIRFAEKIGVREVNFLPYHRFAESKYSYMGLEYWNPSVERLDDSLLKEFIDKIETFIKVKIGG
ncbi:glycyl-radical enzyme activating protein [Alkalibacter saccharofermentans]|uniref:Pyruvate formate lyase activating enzyme n=1 Tax=Alkalibacter saccharofermentans DSM 14828 TaxID=1120975 RepID=A0A1M4UYB3_9FIRM|nr:glycyl-radical enzyme activating protein [Alkalibacter saccharofermentans]SHE61613.1 pyruvate formate lyase activating enzyme [Alkalibacter saccharofermentans DSM 14828]